MTRPRFPDDQQDAGSPHGYGSAHGGWVLSREDKEDIRKLMEEEEVKRSAQNGFRRSETVSQGSSLATPRGELSYMGLVESDEKFPGSGETRSTSGSGPTRKRSEGMMTNQRT